MSYRDLYNNIKMDIEKIIDDNPDFNRKDFNKVINQILIEKETGKSNNDLDIIEFFSGRGRAWVTVDKDLECNVWNQIMSTLSVDVDSENFKYFSSYKDMFDSLGMAWLRYGGINKKGIQLHLRYFGSKNIEHEKIYVSKSDLNRLINLVGVPHRVGLESGDKIDFTVKKKSLDDPKVDTNDFFTLIEDVL